MKGLRQEMAERAEQLFREGKLWRTAFAELTEDYAPREVDPEGILDVLAAAKYGPTPMDVAYANRSQSLPDIAKLLKKVDTAVTASFLAEVFGALRESIALRTIIEGLKGSFNLQEARDAATSAYPLIGYFPPKADPPLLRFDTQNNSYAGHNLKYCYPDIDLTKPSGKNGFLPELLIRPAVGGEPEQVLFSPDIIPRLTSQKGFREKFGVFDDKLWNDRFPEDKPHQNKTSYVYVRFSNSGNVPLTPACALYYASGGTVSHPNQWTRIGVQYARYRMPPGAREVLEFKVPELKAGHYCFVAIVESGLYPVFLPDPIKDAVDLVKSRKNLGWHNFDVIPASSGEEVKLNFNLGNVHAEERQFELRILAKDLPQGAWSLTGKIGGQDINKIFLENGNPKLIHTLKIPSMAQPKTELTLKVPNGIPIDPTKRPHLLFIQKENHIGDPSGGINFHLAPKP